MSIISNVMEQVNKSDKKQLKGKLRTGTVALLIALLAAASATYAWYIYIIPAAIQQKSVWQQAQA